MSSVPLSDTPFEEGISKERERRRCEVDDDDDDDDDVDDDGQIHLGLSPRLRAVCL